MSHTFMGLVNQNKPKYLLLFPARFGKQDENDVVLDEIEFYFK